MDSNTLSRMVLLLPAAWLGCFLLLREAAARRRIGSDWRYSFLLATAAFGAWLTLGTEILSLANSLNAPAVRLFWLFANVLLWRGLFFCRRRASGGIANWNFTRGLNKLHAWPRDAQVVLGLTLLFAIFLGGIALFTPTTNWDSLTYHLPRVLSWIQQGSVAHFPTNMDGQNLMGPWSAFVQAHCWLLWGNDHLENMLQWSAMLGCLVMATLLVRQLLPEATATRARAEAFAALLVATLPTGIVEAITTQTDYTAGFWLMCLASVGLAWVREPVNRVYAAGFGIALGLGVLTKFTIVMYAAPIGLAVAGTLLWKQRRAWRQIVLPAAGALVICLALTLPHFLRNQSVYGSAVASQSLQEVNGIPHLSVSAVVFNLLHNLELHTNTGLEPLTHFFNRIIHVLEEFTGRAANDPDLSLKSSRYAAPDEFFVFDSFAASPWHVLLIMGATIFALTNPQKHRLVLLGLGLALAGLVIFCAALRWQMWNSRYHLPELVLLLPLVAAVLAPHVPRWSISAVAVGLLIFGMIIVAHNRSRPIFDASWRAQPRLQQMFSFQGAKYYPPMRLAVGQIMAAGCSEVGIKFSGDHAEYPFWLMLREAGFQGGIHHEFVDGPSARLPGSAHPADVIVTTMSVKPVGDMALRYPTGTEISPNDGRPIFTLYWSAKISEKRPPDKKAE